MSNNDTLMHWKYIKKERKNGKWRYYYNLGGKTGVEDPNPLIKSYSKLEDKLGFDERDRANHQQKLYEQEKARSDNYTHNPNTDAGPDYTMNFLASASMQGMEALKAKVDFMNTPLGRLQQVKKDAKKAAKAVSKALNKLGSKLKSLFK